MVTQINIDDKKKENERLIEYINLEQEKLELDKKGVEEDKEKFERMINDSEKLLKNVEDENKAAILKKNEF